MGKLCKLTAIIGVLLIAVAVQKFWTLTRPQPRPALSLTERWTQRPSSADNSAIVPQQIFYDPEVIASLRRTLNVTLPLHEPLEGMKHEHDYGLNPNKLRSLIDYWRDSYLPRWSERQQLLNSVPHFKTDIQGLSVHFVHIQPKPVAGKTIVPLLILHGWPGSVREFYDLFPLLTQPQPTSDVIFEVIAPSLPGYAWSEGATRVNFGPAEIAVVLRNLMLRIGHQRFLVQGGDWGSIVGSHLATLFPENVIGYHSNFCVLRTALSTAKLAVASFYPAAFMPAEHVSWVFPALEHFKKSILFMGYFHLQATKPDTIGLALTGNPVGLAAWYYEKYVGAFPDHDVDTMLDIISIYYLTNSAHTSGRLYAEAMSSHQAAHDLYRVPVTVPTACTRYERDISHLVDWQLTDKYVNLVHSAWIKGAGHFAALENAKVFYADFAAFVGKIELK